MVTVDTFWAKIYLGCKHTETGIIYPIEMVKEICQKHCDEIGLCVTVTPTEYIYTDGNEPGAEIGLINYPRFPSTPEVVRKRAIELAQILKRKTQQHRVSIMMPDETVMLGDEE